MSTRSALDAMTGHRMRFYHGGTPGLAEGTRLTPHPDMANSLVGERLWTLAMDPLRNERVFFTDHLPWAHLYALWYRERFGCTGCVYEVLPEGSVEPDPSDEVTVRIVGGFLGASIPARCYRAPSAIVMREVPLDRFFEAGYAS